MRLPASPMPFSSNNRSISGSPVMDGSFSVQQISNQDPNSQQQRQSQQHQGSSSATSMPASRIGQVQFSNANRIPASFNQDSTYYSQLQKKPRLDIKQEDRLPPQVLQQFLQRQDSSHVQYPNPQLQALIQQKLLREQQQLLQSLSPIQRAQLLEKHQLQLRNQYQQQGLQPSSAGKRPYDSGVVCSRRLMQYLYHQRQRPQDNNIGYWRKFVAEYYSPSAKERWCLSLYNNVGYQSPGVFPQATMDPWHCDICGSKPGRGFEATFEVLPRLNEIKFGSGVIDELLFLDLPRECRLPSGKMMLEYARAVQESVYEQVRVVHEGHLRIIFETDLKISSWEFCARRHEELLPRRLVAPQVNQLLQIAQKCQSSIPENGANAASHQELQANCNMFVNAGRQLARSLELQPLNDLGFSKRYVRSLQISEVVNSTKDLMDFCMDQKVGPIEGLKAFTQHITASKQHPQNMQNIGRAGGNPSLQTDFGGFNKPMSQHPGFNVPISNDEYMQNKDGLNGGSAKAPFAATNYQNMLGRSSMNSNHSSLTQEASPSVNSSNSNQSTTVHKGPGGGLVPVTLQTSPANGNGNSPQSADSSHQALQTQMIQQPSHEMADNGGNGWPQQYATGQNTNATMSTDGNGFQSDTPAGSTGTPNTAANYTGATAPSRNNSFKTNSNCESSVSCLNSSGGGFNQRSAESSQGFPEELVSDITDEFTGNGFLTGDIDDYINFDWNA